MIPLSIEFKKQCFVFKQVERQGDVAIYSQSDVETGALCAYEVFIIQKQPDTVLYGRAYPSREMVPGRSMWGLYGYTCHTLERAHIRLNEFKIRISNRKQETVSTSNEDPFGGLTF